MSTIRRQSILSSGIIYLGFALGFLNTYLFTREGHFSPSEYGLYNIFIAIANIIFSFANLGMQAYIYKFYPYYHDNLDRKENDMAGLAFLSSALGFLLVMFAGYIFKSLVIRKFGANSGLLIKYYSWVFPLGFGLTMYSLLEAYAWQLRRAVLTNLLREFFWRVITLILILLFYFGVIANFGLFIKLFSLSYGILAAVLLGIMIRDRQIHITFKISRVTRRFRKKILLISSFIWSGNVINNVVRTFDTIVIAAVLPDGLAMAAIFALAQNVAQVIQAPQRGIISVSIGPLSRAWKDKDLGKLDQIYKRSSINLLLFASALFFLIWINFTDGVKTFHLKPDYLSARHVFLFLGLIQVIDLGTGLNSQIIGTSNYWRFEFVTGIVLLTISLPLNYIFTKKFGIDGTAVATLIALTIYNAIRYLFLWRRFQMQPFTAATAQVIGMAVVTWLLTHFLFQHIHGISGMTLRSVFFLVIYLGGALLFKVSPDVIPVWNTLKKKMSIPYLRSRK